MPKSVKEELNKEMTNLLRELGLKDEQDFPWMYDKIKKFLVVSVGSGMVPEINDGFEKMQIALTETLKVMAPLTPEQRGRVLRSVEAYFADIPKTTCRCMGRGPSHDCPIHGR